MVRRFGRTSRRVVPPALLALALTVGCGGPMLDDDRIVATLQAQLQSQGVQADDLQCPDLPAEVGRSVRCTFTVGGQPVDAVATVSAVDGGTVTYEIHTEARPVMRAVLERAVAGKLVEIGAPAGPVSCSGDLPAQVGATTTCTLTGADGATDWTVTTTSVDGGKIDYSIEQAGLT
jgi:hypothetical protein